MTQVVMLCAPNHVDSTYYNVVYSGGSWVLPLENLSDDNVSTAVARSSSASTANAQFEVYLGGIQEVKVSVVPWHNLSRTGALYRVRYSDDPAWSGATVNGNVSAGASSFTLLAGATDVDLVSGQKILFAGHDTEYTISTTATVSASGTQSVSISPNLTANIVATEVITCCNGDYSTPLYDSGWVDPVPTIYPSLFPYWGHPSFWDGKPTSEQWATQKYPIEIVHDEVLFPAYQKWEFDDTSNATGYIELPRLFVAQGYQPPYNCIFGTTAGITTQTTMRRTVNSRRKYRPKPQERTYNLLFSDLSVDEVYSNFFDTLRSLGIDKQVYVIFDPDDTVHTHRRSMIANVAELPTLSYDYFGGLGETAEQMLSFGIQLTEVVA